MYNKFTAAAVNCHCSDSNFMIVSAIQNKERQRNAFTNMTAFALIYLIMLQKSCLMHVRFLTLISYKHIAISAGIYTTLSFQMSPKNICSEPDSWHPLNPIPKKHGSSPASYKPEKLYTDRRSNQNQNPKNAEAAIRFVREERNI